jgi:hypothetical protein
MVDFTTDISRGVEEYFRLVEEFCAASFHQNPDRFLRSYLCFQESAESSPWTLSVPEFSPPKYSVTIRPNPAVEEGYAKKVRELVENSESTVLAASQAFWDRWTRLERFVDLSMIQLVFSEGKAWIEPFFPEDS